MNTFERTTSDLRQLGLKLLETFHLNVPERRALPRAGMPFSALVAAVADRLEHRGWFPSPIEEENGIGEGARIELREQPIWLHEQHEIGVGRFGPIRSRRVRPVNELLTCITRAVQRRPAPSEAWRALVPEAVRLYIQANGGSPIDGIHVDWNG